jgi:isopenicillin N synthase-like dioxygenase
MFFAWFRELATLHDSKLYKPPSARAQLLQAFDVAQPCTVPRVDAQEPVFVSDELRGAAHLAPNITRDLANRVRTTMAQQGFIRLRLNDAEMKQLMAMQEMQKAFFDLPSETKLLHSSVASGGMSGNYQPSFGYTTSTSCNKEYFVVRQPVASRNERVPSYAVHPSAAKSTLSAQSAVTDRHTLPKAPVDVGAAVWPVYFSFGQLCQSIMRLVMRDLDIDERKISQALDGSMDAAKDMLEFGHTSVIELFHYRRSPAADGKSLPCSIHTDASFLTIIPRCVGPAGLELFNWSRGDWQAVEAQAMGANECIVFPGDMMHRLLNGAILATEHRVVLSPTGETQSRYSSPFELFASPRYLLDCGKLLEDSWQHFGSRRTLLPNCERRETAQVASCAFSQGLVSVNKGDV